MAVPEGCFRIRDVEFHTHPVRNPFDGTSVSVGPGQLMRVEMKHGPFGEQLPNQTDVTLYMEPQHGPLDWSNAKAIAS